MISQGQSLPKISNRAERSILFSQNKSIDLYIYYIHPELRMEDYPFLIGKGSKAAFRASSEGSTREQRGSTLRGANGRSKGALRGSAWAPQVGAKFGCPVPGYSCSHYL